MCIFVKMRNYIKNFITKFFFWLGYEKVKKEVIEVQDNKEQHLVPIVIPNPTADRIKDIRSV